MTDTYLAAAGTIGTLQGLFLTHPEPETEPVPDVGFDGFDDDQWIANRNQSQEPNEEEKK